MSIASIPAARRTDPQSSHIASREVTTSGRRETQADVFLALVREHPGETARELAGHSQCFDRYQANRRLSDLERVESIRKGRPRKCRITGREEVTWFAAPQGERHADSVLIESCPHGKFQREPLQGPLIAAPPWPEPIWCGSCRDYIQQRWGERLPKQAALL